MDHFVEHSPALLELGSLNDKTEFAHSDVRVTSILLNQLAIDPFLIPASANEAHGSTHLTRNWVRSTSFASTSARFTAHDGPSSSLLEHHVHGPLEALWK